GVVVRLPTQVGMHCFHVARFSSAPSLLIRNSPQHPLEQRHECRVLRQDVGRQRGPALSCPLEQKLHVDKNLIHIVSLLSPANLLPKLLFRRSEKRRDEAVLLDVTWGEGAIEVVDDGCTTEVRGVVHNTSPAVETRSAAP